MYAIVDLETSGPHPSRDRIIEVAVLVHNGKRVVETFSSLVNPLVRVPPFIQSFTGIRQSLLDQAPVFEDIMEQILALTEDKIFVAHNVGFDYGFLRETFRQHGKLFKRRQLCTVRLSRKVIPDMPSYSLGKLCDALDIKLLDRHRAFGDAEATARLMDIILRSSGQKEIEAMIKDEMKDVRLPKLINRSVVDELPDTAGVYYFHNAKNQVIYVGKSKTIRKRVLAHFSGKDKIRKGLAMKDQIHHISYWESGTELMALVKESEEIKRLMPFYNRSQKRKKLRYGLYVEKDECGYQQLAVRLLRLEQAPIKSFVHRKGANSSLLHLVNKFELCYQKVDNAGLFPSQPCLAAANGRICEEECPAKLQSPEAYNQGVEKMTKAARYPYDNFAILLKGRTSGELGFILVKNQVFYGYGFIEDYHWDGKWRSLVNASQEKAETVDMKQLILAFLRKKHKAKIVKFSDKEVQLVD